MQLAQRRRRRLVEADVELDAVEESQGHGRREGKWRAPFAALNHGVQSRTEGAGRKTVVVHPARAQEMRGQARGWRGLGRGTAVALSVRRRTRDEDSLPHRLQRTRPGSGPGRRRSGEPNRRLRRAVSCRAAADHRPRRAVGRRRRAWTRGFAETARRAWQRSVASWPVRAGATSGLAKATSNQRCWRGPRRSRPTSIVMGAHGRPAVERFVLGSAAERTVRRADRPVHHRAARGRCLCEGTEGQTAAAHRGGARRRGASAGAIEFVRALRRRLRVRRDVREVVLADRRVRFGSGSTGARIAVSKPDAEVIADLQRAHGHRRRRAARLRSHGVLPSSRPGAIRRARFSSSHASRKATSW